jgi:O-antigen/teichoic acid export membrane protein
VAIWLLWKNFKNLLVGASVKRMVAILKTAWPFAIAGGLGALLTNADILIISWMRSAADVGIYSASIRIVQVLYIIPAIIQLSTLPIFSRLAKRDNEKFRIALENTIALIFLVAVPLSCGGAILGTQIMQLVFGAAYAAGGIAFSILILGLLFDYASAVVSNAIFAYDHQKSLIVCSAIAGASNVIFDLLLIPHWGIAGSAVATLIAQVLSNAYLWHSMKKLNNFRILPRIRKIAVAGACMSAVTLLLFAAHMGVVLNIIVSSIVYLGMLYILREPVLVEIKTVVSPKIAAM